MDVTEKSYLFDKVSNFNKMDAVSAKGEEAKRWSEWASLAQKGDADAYRKLLGEISPKIRSFVRQKAGNAGAPDDITQDVLIAIHSSLHTYNSSQSFKSWLFAIARYKIIDFLRERQRKWGQNVEFDENVVTNSDDSSKESEGLLEDQIEDAVSELPDEMKRAVELTKLKGLSTKEAAQQEGVSPAALRTRISRAYMILRRRLEKEFG